MGGEKREGRKKWRNPPGNATTRMRGIEYIFSWNPSPRRTGQAGRKERKLTAYPCTAACVLMTTQSKVLLLASALLAVSPMGASAATVLFTLASPINVTNSSSPFFLDIAPDIVNADALLSIDGGTISGGEGSTFTVSARYSSGPDDLAYQFTFPFEGSTVTRSLTIVPTSSISAGMLTGLVFTFNKSLNIPAGTVFSFNATPVPEPASVALWAGGAASAALVVVRRRQKVKPPLLAQAEHGG
jgi:hypothetical protein